LLGDCPEIKGEVKRKNRKMTCLIHLVAEDRGPKGVKPQEVKNMVVILSANHPDFRIDIENTSSGFPIIQDAEGEHVFIVLSVLGGGLNDRSYFPVFPLKAIATEDVSSALVSLVVDGNDKYFVIIAGSGHPPPDDRISNTCHDSIVFI
jgi:hypothetical protein